MARKPVDYACEPCGNVVELNTGGDVIEPQRVLLCRICKKRTIHRRIYDAAVVIPDRMRATGRGRG